MSYINGKSISNRIKAIESFVRFIYSINKIYKTKIYDKGSTIKAQEALLSICGLRETLGNKFAKAKN